MQAGGFLGWLTTPVLWVFAGPFRWFALLGGMASQESAYDRDAVGDLGMSVGILQFGKSMWDVASGTGGLLSPPMTAAERAWWESGESGTVRPDDPRFSPFQSGYLAAKYVRIAIIETPRWWTFAIPLYGFAVMRYMWTCGTSKTCGERPAFDSTTVTSGAKRGKWDRMIDEGQRASGSPTRGLTAFLSWRLLVLPLEACVFIWGTRTTVKGLLRRAA
jgi:hypothetical protein